VALALTMQGWKRWLGAAVLAAVVAQGLLGRYRVDLNALLGSTLALVHGAFAALVFALLVAAAVWTSPGWNAPTNAQGQSAWRWRHVSLMTAAVIYGQMLLGAVVRHKDYAWGARAHLLGAFVVVAAVVWLVKLAAEERRGGWGAGLLAALVTVQVGLGVESWLSKFAFRGHAWSQLEPLPVPNELIRTAHYLVGALTFATAVTVALWAHRQTAPARPAQALEGAA
jgi:heme A synthase